MVLVAYVECIVRFARYFEAVPQAIDAPLSVFLSTRSVPLCAPSQRESRRAMLEHRGFCHALIWAGWGVYSGLLHPNALVRSEVTRQFTRFVRTLRVRLAGHVHGIYTFLQVGGCYALPVWPHVMYLRHVGTPYSNC